MTHGQYDPLFVALSVLIAIFAGYTALDLASSVLIARGKGRAGLLAGGSVAMGTGIWSMHFVGMLAFSVSGVPISYYVPLLILSIIVAIAASAIALFVASRAHIVLATLVVAGLAMGVAICGMHYTAMGAMWLLPTGAPVPPALENVLATDGLAVAVTLTTILILGIALTGAVVERALTRRSVMTVEAERRARDEAALHEVASALAGASSVQEIVQCVVDRGLQKTHALGAYIERVEPDRQSRCYAHSVPGR